MEAHALDMLARIGDQLDRRVFPCVANGGFVVLNESTVPSTPSTERHHARHKERGPAARSRQGTTGRQRPSGGPWPTGHATSVVGAGLEADYEVEVSELREQYPGAQLVHQDDGIWLLTKSCLLPGLRQCALFLTGISFPGRSARSWAFWGDPFIHAEWIGPRHTNFPDGSVCAFDPAEGTWNFGDPLVKLLDLYTLWAARQLYLSHFGRWPGQQSVHFPGERILELRPDEYCGCSDGTKLYSECCELDDLRRNQINESLSFYWKTGECRKPPRSVLEYVRFQNCAPDLRTLVTKSSPLTLFWDALNPSDSRQ